MFGLFGLCSECSHRLECLDSARNVRIVFEMFGLFSKCSDYLLPQLRGEVVVELVGPAWLLP